MSRTNIIILMLLILAILAYAAFQFGTARTPAPNQDGRSQATNPDQTAPAPSAANFDQAGNLVKNNPGMDLDAWYLVYEKPGSPALTKKIIFDRQSQCDIGDVMQDCANANLAQGIHVAVQGIIQGDSVLARQISDQSPPATQMIKLYYYDPNNDKDAQGNILCRRQGLVAVTREIPVTQTPIQDAVKLLLEGDLTAAEKQSGITTEYPLAGFSLKGAALLNGSLTLEFDDPNNRSSGGSCRAGILWYQIEATAKQFTEVKEVHFIPKTLFQP